MDNLKCLSAYACYNLNKEDAIASIDLIDACETLCREWSKSLKIAKKFHEELKLANLEKDELIVRLDVLNKKEWISEKLIFLSRWKGEKFGTKVSWVWS